MKEGMTAIKVRGRGKGGWIRKRGRRVVRAQEKFMNKGRSTSSIVTRVFSLKFSKDSFLYSKYVVLQGLLNISATFHVMIKSS